MRSANPTLKAGTFEQFRDFTESSTMTIGGTANKTLVLLLFLAASAAFSWNAMMNGGAAVPPIGLVLGGAIIGLVFATITVFKPRWASFTAPLYALAEGAVLGGISALFEARYPGIAFQAVCLTFCTLFGLLGAYKSGLIKATENFKLGVCAATGGICLVYLVSFVVNMIWGFGTMPYIHSAGPIGIGISAFVVVIAALNLVLDFDFIENGAEIGAPKYMEWYAAFGLLVTLVWLYLEILRLLSKLSRRD